MLEPSGRSPLPWAALLLVSGAVGLGYEVVWLRQLGLVLGGSAVAGAITVGAFMGGLALGGAWSARLRGSAVGTYAALEAGAAAWALAFPWLLDLGRPLAARGDAPAFAVALALLLPPSTLLGATWPLLARTAGTRTATLLYASNTAGAVLGVLGATFVLLPALGVRATELVAAATGLAVALAALSLARPPGGVRMAEELAAPRLPRPLLLLAAFSSGCAALGLEVVWMRLASVALGATVQTLGWVLATFLATVAVGAALGRRWPADPRAGLIGSLAALGALALLGAAAWGALPHGVAWLYRLGGPDVLLPGSALLAALAMGGAPVASGMAFSLAVRCLGRELEVGAAPLYAANTLGSIAGAWVGGLWAIPALEMRGAVLLFAGLAAAAAVVVSRRPWVALPVVVPALLLPAWDARLYAVGVHLRISDFADPSARAIREFADTGWELLFYDQGATGAVAVGRSTRSGNVWLSINGKVDASSGADMPTQVLSGELPVRLARDPARVLVVGLASGVTAGAALASDRVDALDLVELEPAVVEASHFFDHVNGRPLDDPRTTLIVEDARRVLQRQGPLYDVIVSEPSNPWITGVSNLFTLEYWELARSRLADDGVFCQWVQLYGLGTEELRAVVRTFTTVFPETWLFESIEGSDVLLIGGAPRVPSDLSPAPRLDPAGVRRLAGTGWLNTDDHPQVEWRAPRWLHYLTAPDNAAAIAEAATPTP